MMTKIQRSFMSSLQHTWFDPTSLMTRQLQWSLLGDDSYIRQTQIELLRVALEKETHPERYTQPKKRGRQRAQDIPPFKCWNPSVVQHIGLHVQDHRRDALFAVRSAGVSVGLVGLSLEAKDTHIVAKTPMIFVAPEWRRRGIGTAIAEHAGIWLASTKQEWKPRHPWSLDASSHDYISAVFVGTIWSRAVEFSDMLNESRPALRWSIYNDVETH
jgi:GNAT superfamily N-acetyltransferase